jgi:hypothetical protein
MKVGAVRPVWNSSQPLSDVAPGQLQSEPFEPRPIHGLPNVYKSEHYEAPTHPPPGRDGNLIVKRQNVQVLLSVLVRSTNCG